MQQLTQTLQNRSISRKISKKSSKDIHCKQTIEMPLTYPKHKIIKTLTKHNKRDEQTLQNLEIEIEIEKQVKKLKFININIKYVRVELLGSIRRIIIKCIMILYLLYYRNLLDD